MPNSIKEKPKLLLKPDARNITIATNMAGRGTDISLLLKLGSRRIGHRWYGTT